MLCSPDRNRCPLWSKPSMMLWPCKQRKRTQTERMLRIEVHGASVSLHWQLKEIWNIFRGFCNWFFILSSDECNVFLTKIFVPSKAIIQTCFGSWERTQALYYDNSTITGHFMVNLMPERMRYPRNEFCRAVKSK